MKTSFLILTLIAAFMFLNIVSAQENDQTEVVDDFDDDAIENTNVDNNRATVNAAVETTQTVTTTVTDKSEKVTTNDTADTSSTSESVDVSQGYGIKCFWFYDDDVTFDFSGLENTSKV